MKFIEFTDSHADKFIVNTDHIVAIAQCNEEDRKQGKNCEVICSNGSYFKVSNSYDSLKRLLFSL